VLSSPFLRALTAALPKKPTSAADTCLRMYSQKTVVAYYSNDALEKPEAVILHKLAASLGSMRVLDIGVGAGRITEHLAWRAREYRAIDLSPDMIAQCRRRFRGRLPESCFEVRDMRDLGYAAHSYDFVLNAFNGIDHLAHAERGRFLAEVRRILVPGGLFCFSTHNTRSLASHLQAPDSTRPEFWRRPLATMKALRRRERFLRLNRAALAQHATADHVVVNDGPHGDFKVQVCYVRTGAQLETLRRAGFKRIGVYSLDSGNQLAAEQLDEATDRWLYYLCS
jgi:SAM-dependent methyltransferase